MPRILDELASHPDCLDGGLVRNMLERRIFHVFGCRVTAPSAHQPRRRRMSNREDPLIPRARPAMRYPSNWLIHQPPGDVRRRLSEVPAVACPPSPVSRDTGRAAALARAGNDGSRVSSIRMMAAPDGDNGARRCRTVRKTRRSRKIDCPTVLRPNDGRPSTGAPGRPPGQLTWPTGQPDDAAAESLSSRRVGRHRAFPHPAPVRPVSSPPNGKRSIGAVAPN